MGEFITTTSVRVGVFVTEPSVGLTVTVREGKIAEADKTLSEDTLILEKLDTAKAKEKKPVKIKNSKNKKDFVWFILFVSSVSIFFQFL